MQKFKDHYLQNQDISIVSTIDGGFDSTSRVAKTKMRFRDKKGKND